MEFIVATLDKLYKLKMLIHLYIYVMGTYFWDVNKSGNDKFEKNIASYRSLLLHA